MDESAQGIWGSWNLCHPHGQHVSKVCPQKLHESGENYFNFLTTEPKKIVLTQLSTVYFIVQVHNINISKE